MHQAYVHTHGAHDTGGALLLLLLALVIVVPYCAWFFYGYFNGRWERYALEQQHREEVKRR